MDFPICELMDEGACYRKLLDLLPPGALRSPGGGADAAAGKGGVHRRARDPVLDYQCSGCGRVFNGFTATVLHGTRKKPSLWLLALRGVAQGVSTARLARELSVCRPHLLAFRRRVQENAASALNRSALADTTVEADEMYQNAGEKRPEARRPRRPAPAAGEQTAGPRHLGYRPPAGAGAGRA